MRLLKRKDDGDFSLTEFVGDNIPPYAILSHTWGADVEEVTFRDLVEGTGKNKAGYEKIRFCGKQAANDGLQYFWVDTCCIEKSSSAELSEAINSMFHWYHDAAKCYVYLSDVSVHSSIESDQVLQQQWKLAFQKSRWFTRGWTLQELIAPASVEFFSVEGEPLGDKKSLEQQIHEITGVNIQALRGRPLSRFSVDERMLWAARRQTKREEDAAYSLLGIFDIHMSLIYGEGQMKALKRLKNKIKKAREDESPDQRVDNILSAAQRGAQWLAAALSENGADINARTNDGNSALMLASMKGYETAVNLLLPEENVDFNCRNNIYATPLIEAAKEGHGRIIRLLLEKGAEVNAQNIYGNSPLSIAAEYGRDLAVEEILRRPDVYVNSRQWDGTRSGRTPLHWAAEKGYEQIVRLLLGRSADVNAIDANHCTPLFLAAGTGNATVVSLLLEGGANTSVKNNHGWTPLDLAESRRFNSIVELLQHRM